MVSIPGHNELSSQNVAGNLPNEELACVPGYGRVDWDEHRLDVTATIYALNHQLKPAAGLRRLTHRRRCVCCGQTRRHCREGKWARQWKKAAEQAGREMHHA